MEEYIPAYDKILKGKTSLYGLSDAEISKMANFLPEELEHVSFTETRHRYANLSKKTIVNSKSNINPQIIRIFKSQMFWMVSPNMLGNLVR